MKQHLTIQEQITYDPETGLFTWLTGRNAGKTTAGRLDNFGYRTIRVNDITFMTHRLAWFLVHGKHPEHCIDHINRVRDDNRLVNLREATRSQNAYNTKKQVNNTSGFKGVTYNKANDTWIAQIKDQGVHMYLGSYKNKIDAAFAYQTYAAKLRGEFYNGVQ
jgi:hypothetical protein